MSSPISQFIVKGVSPEVGANLQGVASDGTHIYTIHTDAIHKWDADWNLVASNETAGTSSGVSHLGDAVAYGNKLLIAACDYTSCSVFGNSRLSVFNLSDLSFVENRVLTNQDNEVSSVAIDGNGILYFAVYCEQKIHKYLESDMSYIGSVTIEESGNDIFSVEGITFDGENFWISASNGKVFKLNNAFVADVGEYYTNCNQGLDYSTDYLYVANRGTQRLIRKLLFNENYDAVNSVLAIRTS